MKEITIDGYTFKVESNIKGGTSFYHGVDVIIRRKYILFGEKYSTQKPKHAFDTNIWIFNPIFSKKDVKTLIKKYMKIWLRKKEIEKGEIV